MIWSKNAAGLVSAPPAGYGTCRWPGVPTTSRNWFWLLVGTPTTTGHQQRPLAGFNQVSL